MQAAPEQSKRDTYLKEHFPDVVYGGKPAGARVLVQLRMVKEKSAGGLYIPQDTRDFNAGQTCIGLIREVGPLAFKNRETMAPWPEGIWAKPGDLVMVERNQGRRFCVPVPDTEDKALFVVLYDHHLDWVIDSDFSDLEFLYENII